MHWHFVYGLQVSQQRTQHTQPMERTQDDKNGTDQTPPSKATPVGGMYAHTKTIKTAQVCPWALIHPTTRVETVQTKSQTTKGVGRFVLLFMPLDTEWGKSRLIVTRKLNPLKHFCRHPPPRHSPSLLRKRDVPTEGQKMGGTPSLSLRPEGQALGCPCHTYQGLVHLLSSCYF